MLLKNKRCVISLILCFFSFHYHILEVWLSLHHSTTNRLYIRMKRISILTALIIYMLNFSFAASSIPSSLTRNIDWPSFMDKQAMTWNVLPEAWYESAYMGNGTLGLMIYKEPGKNALRFETGNSEVHDHRPEKGLLGNPRLLTGHFLLHPVGNIIKGNMKLDIWNAETSATIVTSEGEICLTALVHSDEMVSIIRIETKGKESNYELEWIEPNPQSPRYLHKQTPAGSWLTLAPYEENPQPVTSGTKQGQCVYHLLKGGTTATVWNIETTADASERTLWVNTTHSYPDTTAAETGRRILQEATKRGFEPLRKSHRAWWNNYYQTSFLTLPDGVKENFYWAQLYKLASATRADRSLIDNCGPWLTITPWPNAWWNLNVQLTYWPLNASNHLDLAASLEHALYDHTENLKANVPEPYRHNSLAMARSTNLVCESEEVGIPGISKTPEIGNLTWACHSLWLVYRHKMDDKLLREKLYPLLKQSINYYIHFLYKGEDGYLHLPETYSPEYGKAPDCNYDLALLRWGCQTLLESAKRLHIKDSLSGKWTEILQHLTPYPQDTTGMLIGRDVPYSFSHRHYSHLLAAYPLYLINIEQAGSKELIERSLAHWQSKPSALRGYSYTGASSLSSALGKGNDALYHLNKLFDKYLSVNTLYRESGPVIETPLSAAQSIHDMLLQSWGNKLRIFPAVPDAWQDISYDQWLAEGGFVVTAQRQAGKTHYIQIDSRAGEPCTVVTDIEKPVFRIGKKKPIRLSETEAHTYTIPLKKGETVAIYPQTSDGTCILQPIENGMGQHFGKKK